MADSQLTSSSLLAAATEILLQGGYRVREGSSVESRLSTERLFEDPYGVVSIVVHDTWQSLASTWRDGQARLVELISARVGPADAKAWEGYLVLLTPGIAATSEERTVARRIRYDTSRVRKLVATGEEIRTTGDVERALASLLPLPNSEIRRDSRGVLETLPALLEESGIPAEITGRLVSAYERQTSLLAALDSIGRSS